MNPNQVEELLRLAKDIRDSMVALAALVDVNLKLANLKLDWVNKSNEARARKEKERAEFAGKIEEFTLLVLDFVKNNEGCTRNYIVKAFADKIGSRYVGRILRNSSDNLDILARGRPRRYYIFKETA